MKIPIKTMKYGNTKVLIDNIVFDSKKEGNRYLELKLLLKAGKIRDLQLQYPFILQEKFTDRLGKKHLPIIYISDFIYWEPLNPNVMIVEDVKGMKTSLYKIKKKMLLFKYPNIFFKEI